MSRPDVGQRMLPAAAAAGPVVHDVLALVQRRLRLVRSETGGPSWVLLVRYRECARGRLQLKITVTSVRYNGSDVASVLLGDRGWFTNSLDACDVGRCCTAAQQHNDRSILLELFKAPGSGARRAIHAVTNV